MYSQFSRASMVWAVILLVVVVDETEKVREEVELEVEVGVLLVIILAEFGKAGGEVEGVNEDHEVVEETEVVTVSELVIFLSVPVAPEENSAALTVVNFIVHLIGLMCIWTRMHSIILQN